MELAAAIAEAVVACVAIGVTPRCTVRGECCCGPSGAEGVLVEIAAIPAPARVREPRAVFVLSAAVSPFPAQPPEAHR